jgi:hypothetical protein
VVGAVLVLVGGVLHYLIWDEDYRSIPDDALPGLDVVKIGFPVNTAVSVLLAVAIVVFARRPIVWLAALLFEAASLVALVLSREGSVFGWKEPDWSTDAKRVLTVEVLAIVVLGLLLVVDFARSSGDPADTDAV